MANSKRRKRRKIIIFLVIGVVVAALAAAAVFRRRETVITVQTEKATRRTLTELVRANGRIQPVFEVKISPEVSGEIIELPVKEGQKVKKNDLLVKIKPDMYVASRNSSVAAYKGALAGQATAQSSLERAEAEFKRIDALHKTDLVSDSVFLEAQTTYDIAKASLQSAVHQVEMAQAALKRAEEDLLKTTIFSPLDGTVSRLNSRLGERVVGTAMMAGTEIMTIADLNEMEARVDVGEIDVVLIQVGQKARLEVDAFKDRKFNGTVTEIANSSKLGLGGGQSQEATKFEVKIRVTEKETFRPGMSVSAEIESRYRTNVLTVPIASVTTRLPKEKEVAKASGTNATNTASAVALVDPPSTNPAASGSANPAPPAGTASAASSTSSTNTLATSSTGGTNATASGGTNAAASGERKKPGESPKPIEVVFTKDGEKAKMVPVKIGISDDSYMEITDGLKEGDEVVSGGYKAISRELEDGKKVRIGKAVGEKDKEKEKK